VKYATWSSESCLPGIEAQLSFQIGAGIQIPPNASRVLAHYGLVQEVEDSGAILLAERVALSYKDGSLLVRGGDPAWMEREFGHYW
jgi:hypothetical protein